MELVERYHASFLRVAQMYVSTPSVAEEVAQEAWLGILAGIERFEKRSSLKTWMFRILTNIAKTRGVREKRSIPFSSLQPEGDEPAVDPERFAGGAWAQAPSQWGENPEERLLGAETQRLILQAIEKLPPAQRAVITMRDVAGLSAEEACSALDVSETNQRVLLHRARSKVRAAIESHLEPT